LVWSSIFVITIIISLKMNVVRRLIHYGNIHIYLLSILSILRSTSCQNVGLQDANSFNFNLFVAASFLCISSLGVRTSRIVNKYFPNSSADRIPGLPQMVIDGSGRRFQRDSTGS
jgi:hypothetical protein